MVSNIQLRKWGLACQGKCSESLNNQGQDSTSNPNPWDSSPWCLITFNLCQKNKLPYSVTLLFPPLFSYWTSELSFVKLKPHLPIILGQTGIFTWVSFSFQEELFINSTFITVPPFQLLYIHLFSLSFLFICLFVCLVGWLVGCTGS